MKLLLLSVRLPVGLYVTCQPKESRELPGNRRIRCQPLSTRALTSHLLSGDV